MSRKLGALAIAMAILVGSMGLKTILAGGNSTTVVAANGPAPMPIPPPPPTPKTSQN
jgi:hypothetical protein